MEMCMLNLKKLLIGQQREKNTFILKTKPKTLLTAVLKKEVRNITGNIV